MYNWTYEFNLFCIIDYHNILIDYSVLFSQFLGTLLLSPFPNKYGRKTIFKILIVISLIIHINLMLVINPLHLIISNFLGGITLFAYTIGFYIIIEYLRKDMTGSTIGFFNSVYPLFGIFLGFFFLTI